MSELSNLIAEISENEASIAKLEGEAAEHVAVQRDLTEQIRQLHARRREAAAQADRPLSRAQSLREQNQRLKQRAGVLALGEAKG